MLCCCHTLNHIISVVAAFWIRVCVFLWVCVYLYSFSNFHHFPFPKFYKIQNIYTTLYTHNLYIYSCYEEAKKRKIQFIPQFICIRKVVNVGGAFLHSVTLIIVSIFTTQKFSTSLPIAINVPLSFRTTLPGLINCHIFDETPPIWKNKNARILYVMFSFTASEGFMYAFLYFSFTNFLCIYYDHIENEKVFLLLLFSVRCCCCCCIFWFFSVSMLNSTSSIASLVEEKLSEIE